MILQKGDKNDFVYGLQELLNKLGYECNINGNYDIKTYNSIIKFQLANRIAVSGILTEETQAKLLEVALKSIDKTQLTKSYPQAYITISEPTAWVDNNWNFILRPKSWIKKEQIVSAGLAQISNISFICHFYGQVPEHILKYRNKDSARNLDNFTVLDSYNYISKPDYLLKGDILFSADSVAIVLTDGIKANHIAPVTVTAKLQKVRINSQKKVNIRYKPSLESSIVTQLSPGTTFTITEEREGWGKLKSGRGWVKMQFVEKL